MSKGRIFALTFGMALGLAASTLVGGCARHVHHHHAPPPKKVVVLDAEHDDRAIVVVHHRPAPERRCWAHRNHWHCRAR